MRRMLFVPCAVLILGGAALAQEQKQQLVTMDEDVWVAFYDLPSRRFHDIRNAFVKQQFPAVARDLAVAAGYLNVETDRAIPALAERLTDVSTRMSELAAHVEGPATTLATFDALFGRAHWLLAQHYLDLAKRSRDRNQLRNEGLYLSATVHHLERAVLWSDARLDRRVQNTLEDLRDLAKRLQDPALAATAQREKPIVRAEKTLRELGKQIERPVVLPAN